MKKHTLNIKTVIFLFPLVGLSGNLSAKDLESKSVSSFYQIIERKTDTSLSVGNAHCRFNLKEYRRMYDHFEVLPSQSQIRISINEKEMTKKPDVNGNLDFDLAAGKYVFFFLADGYMEVVTDTIVLKSQESILTNIALTDTTGYTRVMVLKPVIYLYPEKIMDVKIKLDVNGNLGFTYPAYNNGWNIIANPDGKIQMDDKEYNYLFWDSEMPTDALDANEKSGFLVSSDTLLSFLENSLDQMGFTAAESADFITFWYPQMIKNEKNFVHFLFNEACDVYAELYIKPKPDHIFRVGMVWTGTGSDFVPEKQIIQKVDRTGFTVIEWGGLIHENLFLNEN